MPSSLSDLPLLFTLLLLLLGPCVTLALYPLEGRPYQPLPHRDLYVRQLAEPFALTATLYQPLYHSDTDYPTYQPYPYAVHPLTAVVQLKGDGPVEGTVLLVQPHPPNGPVFISGNITGLSPGKHGFHIHSLGDMRDGCKSTGFHYNPYQTHHGGPVDPFRHVGDLGNIVAGEDGTARLQLSDHVIALSGPYSVLGRAIIVHEKEDDLGRGGDKESLKTGNAGGRVACGVIAFAETVPADHPPPSPLPPTAAPTPTIADEVTVAE